MTENMLTKVNECEHSSEVWDKVKCHFGINTKAKIHQYRAELRSAKKDTRSMLDFLLIIKAITDAFRAIGSPVSEHEHIQCILEGLPSEYEAFVTSANMKSDISLQMLQQWMPRIKILKKFPPQPPQQNFRQYNNNNRGGGRNGGRSFKGGGGRGRGGFNGGFQSNKPFVVCQVCSKPGHIASACYYQFDSNYHITEQQYNQNFNQFRPRSSGNVFAMLATPDTICDSTWFPNSGATSHVTSDPSNLMSSMQYLGPEQLHMGNGTGLHISRVGQSLVKSPFHSDISFRLNNLLLVPNITKNLVSVSKFTKDSSVFFEFHANHCFVKTQDTNHILLIGSTRPDGLYYFDNFHPTHQPPHQSNSLQANSSIPIPIVLSFTVNANVSACNSVTSYTLWHCRLGNSNTATVLSVLKQCNVPISNKGMSNLMSLPFPINLLFPPPLYLRLQPHSMTSPTTPTVTVTVSPNPITVSDTNNIISAAAHSSSGKYIHDLLCKTKLDAADFISTPMVSNFNLSKDGDNLMSDPTLYCSTVGALQYITITRPDLSFTINKNHYTQKHSSDYHIHEWHD
ncbi:Retrovirus-related Pol polyprotein from transposon TNT 1-94 [Senna tora]|uniref:Retrovirus-related Pol polyprotein from transposon TNT 1-94 n=1 Tax=Senna tora TaxID=362788 RepID=A0A834W9M3_9FABA|nr:Retrovirus-related Pol polyprotein from transposon TNT 1-94 [Senna tora]